MVRTLIAVSLGLAVAAAFGNPAAEPVFRGSPSIFLDLQEHLVGEGETALPLAGGWRSVSLATQPPE